jgi:hypothetical protein
MSAVYPAPNAPVFAFARQIERHIVVDVCPFCGEMHRHLAAPDGDPHRIAECLRGEYELVFIAPGREETHDV